MVDCTDGILNVLDAAPRRKDTRGGGGAEAEADEQYGGKRSKQGRAERRGAAGREVDGRALAQHAAANEAHDEDRENQSERGHAAQQQPLDVAARQALPWDRKLGPVDLMMSKMRIHHVPRRQLHVIHIREEGNRLVECDE